MENTAPQVRIGDWIGEGWKMFTEQWKGWVTISLGFFVAIVAPVGVFFVGIYVTMIATMMSQPATRGAPPQVPVEMIIVLYLGMFGILIILMPLSVFVMGGAYRAAFKQLRGGRVEFRDLFSARDCFWRLLGASIIHSLLVGVGMLLCIIPGFIVAGLMFFTLPLIVERDLGVFEAMSASRDVAQRNLFKFTLFAILVQIIASIGSQACYVGLLATWPLMFTISAVAFRDCFGVEGARSFSQRASPPSGYPAAAATYGAPSPEGSIACPNCHGSLPPTARFCYHCGAGLTS